MARGFESAKPHKIGYLSSSLGLYARGASCGNLSGRCESQSRSQSDYLHQRAVVRDDGDRSSPLVRTKRAGQRALPCTGRKIEDRSETSQNRFCAAAAVGLSLAVVWSQSTPPSCSGCFCGKGHRHPLGWSQVTPKMRRTTIVNLASVSFGTARTPESCRTYI